MSPFSMVDPVSLVNPLPQRAVGGLGAIANSPTYRATGNAYQAYATPTDLLTISGSDSKAVVVTALNISPGATATAVGTFFWVKRSAANTGGTKAAQAAVPLDSADPAATAVVSLYSVIPSALGAGTAIAIVGAAINAVAGAPGSYGYVGSTLNGAALSPTSLVDIRKPIVLRGANEFLALNYNGAAIPAGFTSTWTLEWIEI